jgi:hypothetical protein
MHLHIMGPRDMTPERAPKATSVVSYLKSWEVFRLQLVKLWQNLMLLLCRADLRIRGFYLSIYYHRILYEKAGNVRW